MAQQIINIGTSPNSFNGDPLRTAFTKINNNTTELYSTYNHTSTQWSATIPNTQINNGTFLSLFSFLSDVDKVASGTVSRDEYSILNGGIIIPYIGKPYENQRLHHVIRVNFDFVTGNIQTVELQLRRTADDSVIGSSKSVSRNTDFGGVFEEFISYTNSATDSFVTGGFYVAIENNSGTNIRIEGSLGVLVQTFYERPTPFLI